jgi:hypothetical protein
LTTQAEWEWIHARARPISCADSQGIVAYKDNGDIQAICVADSFTVDACSVHFAIDNPFVIRAGFFHEISRHLYCVCGRDRLFGLVPGNNAKALKLDKHIGFREVARIPDGFAKGIDYVVLRMDKQGCRWLTEEQQQEAA